MEISPFKRRKVSTHNETSEQENPNQAPKMDLFDLPLEVLLRIFDTGTSLKAAELVCKKWHEKTRAVPDFWQLACKRILIDEEMIKRNLSDVLNVNPKFISLETAPASIWRRIWFKHAGTARCQHCHGLAYCDYKAYNMMLCSDCRFLEPYSSWDKQ